MLLFVCNGSMLHKLIGITTVQDKRRNFHVGTSPANVISLWLGDTDTEVLNINSFVIYHAVT